MRPVVALIISVKEARKLLGKDGRELSDDQIEQLIISLTEVSGKVLDHNGVPKIPQGGVQ